MKKIFLFICIAFTTYGTFAQRGPRERMKAFKVAFITEKLSLTSTEAQQFWPIYNAHETTTEKLKEQERTIVRKLQGANNGPNGLSNKEAGEFLDQYLKIEEEKFKAKQQLITDLKKNMSYKKILRLIKAESDFNKRILERIRERRKMN